MSRIEESLFWREFDRLVIFVAAYQELFFTLPFLQLNGFVVESQIELGALIEWAVSRGLLRESVQRVVFSTVTGEIDNVWVYHGYRLSGHMWTLFRTKKRRGRERKRDKVEPTKIPFEQVVHLGRDSDTGKLAQSSLGETLALLRRFHVLSYPLLKWLLRWPCVLYNQATGKLEPGTFEFGDEARAIMPLLADLSAITPVYRCTKTNDTLWRVLRPRVMEIVKALDDCTLVPHGDCIAPAQLSDILFQSFYGLQRLVAMDGFTQVTLSASTYRKVLRWLANKPEPVLDLRVKDALPVPFGTIWDILVEDLAEAGLLQPSGPKKEERNVCGINQAELRELLGAVYNPSSLPEYFGAQRGAIRFLGSGGPIRSQDELKIGRWQ